MPTPRRSRPSRLRSILLRGGPPPLVRILAACLLTACLPVPTRAATVVLHGEGSTEVAPHGHGNVYAPEVHRDADGWRMWYGGQGKDGHDRIHLAGSADGLHWQRAGVAIDCGTNNHVNDPSVVRVGDVWWMFYTVAARGEHDAIAAATSTDARHWTLHGTVLPPGTDTAWDSAKVGRPSVLHESGRFRLWYDGQPTAAAAAANPAAAAVRNEGGRAVGLAESTDGLTWTRHPEPVLHGGAGAIHVRRWGGGLVLVHESHRGTLWAESRDGLRWTPRGILHPLSGDAGDRFGQVTPFLGPSPGGIDGPPRLYFGSAAAATWDHNTIAAADLDPLPVRDGEGEGEGEGAADAGPWIGYTRLRTDLPGGRHANIRTMRARLVRRDGTGDRPVGEGLADDPDAWTQFAGWSPGGGTAVILRGWQDPRNAAWEEEHRQFRFAPGAWKLDIHLVDPATGQATNLSAIDRVSDYNSGLFFLPGGRTLGFTALVDGVSRPFLMDADGRHKRDVSGQGGFAYGYGASPDGRWVSWHEDYRIQVARADGTGRHPIETGHPFNFGPQWSPDGRWLLFSAGTRGNSPPHIVRPDGTGLRQLADLGGYPGWTLFLDVDDFHEGSSDSPVWAADGSRVFYTARTGGSVELFSVTLDGIVTRWTHSPPGVEYSHPKPSPEGRWLAIEARRDGVRQLVVLRLSDRRETTLTGLTRGSGALWAHWQPAPPGP